MKKHPMKKQLLAMMNDVEQELLRDIFDGDLADLPEDDLVDLHNRVRRARNKYSKLYRRRSAAKVQADKGRAKASAANRRTARKAEIFEDALAKVSRQLARAARASAEDLKAARLAAARGARSRTPAGTPSAPSPGRSPRRSARPAPVRRSAAAPRRGPPPAAATPSGPPSTEPSGRQAMRPSSPLSSTFSHRS